MTCASFFAKVKNRVLSLVFASKTDLKETPDAIPFNPMFYISFLIIYMTSVCNVLDR